MGTLFSIITYLIRPLLVLISIASYLGLFYLLGWAFSDYTEIANKRILVICFLVVLYLIVLFVFQKKYFEKGYFRALVHASFVNVLVLILVFNVVKWVKSLDEISFNVREQSVALWITPDKTVEDLQCFFEQCTSAELLVVKQDSLIGLIIIFLLITISVMQLFLIHKKQRLEY